MFHKSNSLSCKGVENNMSQTFKSQRDARGYPI